MRIRSTLVVALTFVVGSATLARAQRFPFERTFDVQGYVNPRRFNDKRQDRGAAGRARTDCRDGGRDSAGRVGRAIERR